MMVYEPTGEQLGLAAEWYGGSGSMLYAVASTGMLSTGTVRPSTHDGDWAWRPMTDTEWAHDLAWRLWREVREIGPMADDQGLHGDAAVAEEWADTLEVVVDMLAELVEQEGVS